MRKLFVAAVTTLALISAGWKTHIVKDRPGGVLIDHVIEFADWQKHNDRVVIAGQCDSACTLLLGIIDPDHVCATSRGSLGFHSASDRRFTTDGEMSVSYSEVGTRFMWLLYGQHIRNALAERGWPEPSKHPDIISIKATELVATCR